VEAFALFFERLVGWHLEQGEGSIVYTEDMRVSLLISPFQSSYPL